MTSIHEAALGVTFFAFLLPALFIAAVAAIIIAVLYFRHRERMAYLSRPQTAPSQDAPPSDYGPERPPGPPPYPPYPPYPSRHHPSLYHPLARVGRLTGIGFGVTLGLLWPFGLSPLLLFGLIPLFIGLIRLGELYISPLPILPPTAQDLAFWLQRSLWSGGIGLALMLGLATVGVSPLLLAGTIPLGYGLGMLLAYALALRGH
jgi:hypothetical protein